MSQPGAFDSALRGWTAERILEHYYPGATFGTVAIPTVGVRLMERDDVDLDVHADAGLRVAGRKLDPGQAAHLTALPGGGANVVVTVGCDGDVLWQSTTEDPWIYPLDPNPGRPAAEHLTLCGGAAYRGSLGLASEGGATRTVNRVGVEDYLRGVVPAEVQANWADKGAAEALRAQAIAARSYALAEHRYPYAQTCDSTDCQAYPGTAAEDPRADAAIAATASTVLLRDGHILRAEYSAAPDSGDPVDISIFDVGPTPAELAVGKPPTDPRTPAVEEQAVDEGGMVDEGSAIDTEYHRIGGAAGALGAPLGPEVDLPQSAGTYRLFSNGVIIATPALGARVVDFTTLMERAPDPNSPLPEVSVAPGAPVPEGNVEPESDAAPEPAASEDNGAPASSDPVLAEEVPEDIAPETN